MLNHAELDSYRNEYEVTIGHDAEVFLKNSDGVSISAIDKVGGSKEKPRATKHGWVQEDGMAAEVNIPPATSVDAFVGGTQLILKDLLSIIEPLDLSIDISATALFGEGELLDPRASIAGCDPDYDAYAVMENTPVHYTDGLRAGAGHIHVGWKGAENAELEELLSLVKAIDLYITLPSVLLDPDTKRRSLYGKAGSFRPKPYGVEARSPSNFWLRTPEEMEWVYYSAIKAHSMRNEGLQGVSEEDIQSIINGSNVEGATQIIRDLNIAMPRGFR